MASNRGCKRILFACGFMGLVVGWISGARADLTVLEFDADSRIDLSDAIERTRDFTVEYWFRTDRATNWQLINYSAHRDFNFGHLNASKIRCWGPWTSPDLSQSFQTGQWEHLAFTREGIYGRFYRSGVEVGEVAWTGTIRIDRLGGGSGGTFNWDDFEGQAAEIRVWDHARTAEAIQNDKDRRLTGNEPGLIAYWRLDDGQGDRVYNLADDRGHGTVAGATWVTTSELTLADAPTDYLGFTRFTVADIETGSTRFTNSNQVDLVSFPIPEGYDQYQFTQSGAVSAIDPHGWAPTNAVTSPVDLTPPSSDTNVILHAWFTNQTASVPLRRSTGEIVYTTTAPTAAAQAVSLRTAGFSVQVTPWQVDGGSGSGLYAGEPIGIHRLEIASPADETPAESFVTLTNAGVYSVTFTVINAAGNRDSAQTTLTLDATDSLPAGDRYVAVGNLFEAHPFDSWTNAAASIQDALDAANDDEVVWVAPGRYTASGANYVVDIDQTDLHLRAVSENPADTLVDGEGVRRGLRVGHCNAEIHGFTIQHCHAEGHGAGVNYSSFSETDGIRLVNCVLQDNYATGEGGAFYAWTSGSFVLEDSIVRRNFSGGGYGIYARYMHVNIIRNTLFEANDTHFLRGRSGELLGFQIENSVFRDHHASFQSPAAVIHFETGDKLLRNCLIADNRGEQADGGAVFVGDGVGTLEVVNCTIVNNQSRVTPAGIRADNPTDVRNTILFGNVLDDDTLSNYAGTLSFVRSCTSPITGFDPADGNLDADPRFVDADAGNYRLQATSPCVNAGMNEPDWMLDAVDLDGNPRIDRISGQVDIGAYEYVPAGSVLLIR